MPFQSELNHCVKKACDTWRIPQHIACDTKKTPHHIACNTQRIPHHIACDTKRIPQHIACDTQRIPYHIACDTKRIPQHIACETYLKTFFQLASVNSIIRLGQPFLDICQSDCIRTTFDCIEFFSQPPTKGHNCNYMQAESRGQTTTIIYEQRAQNYCYIWAASIRLLLYINRFEQTKSR